MKRIIICCDGTWNELDFRVRPVTNVVKMAQSVALSADQGGEEVEQVVFYDEGVGTLDGESIDGGGFGDGLIQNIIDAYMFLVFNYQPGDEIYVFGFSRGAYTARSLVGMVRNCGIMRRDAAAYIGDAMALYQSRHSPKAPESVAFRQAYGHEGWWIDADKEAALAQVHPGRRIKIDYLGIWDTVGQNGVPNVINAIRGKNEDHGFHDLKLSSVVRRARHAVGIDEMRAVFRPTLWEQEKLTMLRAAAAHDPARGNDPDCYLQLWFPGDHGSVGGGGDETGLSDLALRWVAEGARRNGLNLAYDDEFENVRYGGTVVGWGKQVDREVVFAPNIDAPLRNVSGNWKNTRKSRLQRLAGYVMSSAMNTVMNTAAPDRLTHLPDLDQLSALALAYPRPDDAGRNYQQGLAERIRDAQPARKARLRFGLDSIRARFPDAVL